MQSQDKKVIIVKKKDEPQNKTASEQKKKAYIPEDFLKEVHGKKCKVWIYANEVWEYTGIVHNAIWNIKITLDTGEVLYFNKGYLIGVKPLVEEKGVK